MSGGVAYLLDLDPKLVNTEMVDLQPLPDTDKKKLQEIVSKFHAETGSKVASSLLKNWDESAKRFTRIMPRDYARVLSVIANAEKSGKQVEQAIMEVLNG